MAEQQWYYSRGGQQLGPIPYAQLWQMAQSGQLTASDLVWTDGMANWQPASAIPELAVRQAAAFAPAYQQQPYAPQSFGQTLPYQSEPMGQIPYADFGVRLVAWLIDFAITQAAGFVIGFAIGLAFTAGNGGRLNNDVEAAAKGTSALAGLVVGWLYFAIQESSSAQATVGKRAMGLRVIDGRGQRISFGRATGRFFAKIISGCVLIGYLMAAWTEKRQALHDMMADTLVIKP